MTRDVAIVSFASSGSLTDIVESETQMLLPVLNAAVEASGVDRSDIGFTCSGSADYLAGTAFAFVANLEAVGAWPPIAESHVDMDGAWALYEAWVRLQHGDIDVAMAFSSGISSRSDLHRVLCLQNDPYYLMPLWADHHAYAALQARALLDAGLATEGDFAAVVARCRRDAADNPEAQVTDPVTVEALLDEPYTMAPLRAADCPPVSDGAAAVIMVAGDRAREVCEHPAWIRGIDHRSEAHYPGLRDLTHAGSARLAGEQAGVGDAPIEVAELAAAFSHEEILLRTALGLGEDTEVNPSGGPLTGNPMMVSGLVRIGEAFRQINERGRHRTLGHAASGPCLQQNLVCVLEGDG